MRTKHVRRLLGGAALVAALAVSGTALAAENTPEPVWKQAGPTAVVAASARRLPPPPAPAAVADHDGPAGSVTTTGTGAVALTFDDGPDPATTPALLKLLAQHHVTATFCLVGTNAEKFPDLVRDIAAAGHTLCNHTWNHDLKLGGRPAAQIENDLSRTNAAIRRAVPDAKIHYMRAPGGNFTDRFVRVADELGMTSIYWQVDPRDWEHPSGETADQHRAKIERIIRTHTREGSIVLSHDYAQPMTIEVYRELLPWLAGRYKLRALPD